MDSELLVLTYAKVMVEEGYFTKPNFHGKKLFFGDGSQFRSFHLLGEIPKTIATMKKLGFNLIPPGLQFLHFLEKDMLPIYPMNPEPRLWNHQIRLHRHEHEYRENVVIDNKAYFFDFGERKQWDDKDFFRKFMGAFNKMIVEIKGGDLVPRSIVAIAAPESWFGSTVWRD